MTFEIGAHRRTQDWHVCTRLVGYLDKGYEEGLMCHISTDKGRDVFNFNNTGLLLWALLNDPSDEAYELATCIADHQNIEDIWLDADGLVHLTTYEDEKFVLDRNELALHKFETRADLL